MLKQPEFKAQSIFCLEMKKIFRSIKADHQLCPPRCDLFIPLITTNHVYVIALKKIEREKEHFSNYLFVKFIFQRKSNENDFSKENKKINNKIKCTNNHITHAYCIITFIQNVILIM